MLLPPVSVIIPTYNGAPWIKETLTSVLGQSYPNIEIIVVNDGSQDSTPQILEEFGGNIQVLRTSRAGIGRARNAGMELAHGRYLAFLDHDDLWAEEKVARQLELFAHHPETVVLYTDADEFDDRGTHAKSFFNKFPDLASSVDIADAMIMRRAVPLMSTIMIRAEFLREHSIRFHDDASGVDDLYLLLGIYLKGGTFARLDDRLVKRRLHSGNLSGNHYNRFAGRIRVYGDLMRNYPAVPSRVHRLLVHGVRDANFRVGEWHWGQLELQKARSFLWAGIGFSRTGIKSSLLWGLTFVPMRLVLMLKLLKQTLVSTKHSDRN